LKDSKSGVNERVPASLAKTLALANAAATASPINSLRVLFIGNAPRNQENYDLSFRGRGFGAAEESLQLVLLID
jgi:hypothetical protein